MSDRFWRLAFLVLLLIGMRYLWTFGQPWLKPTVGGAGYEYPSNDAEMANLAVAFESRMGGVEGFDGKDPEEVVWSRWKSASAEKKEGKLLDAGYVTDAQHLFMYGIDNAHCFAAVGSAVRS
jgi:hypothetical protein